MSRPFWLSAFLDYPADRLARGTGFWSDVTGFRLSERRGEHDEFATLVPADGDDYLRVQCVGDGEPSIHLDVHVADPQETAATATGLDATVLADHGGYLTLSSPGALTFCLVSHPAGVRPPPRVWPTGRTSLVDQVCLDVPPSRFETELAFWHALTGWERRDPTSGKEFRRLSPSPDQPLQLLVQRLHDEQPAVTAHLDWETTDRDAEVADHVAAGATEGSRHEGWTVMHDPAGMVYCVTGRAPR